jgi:hypothetical protein
MFGRRNAERPRPRLEVVITAIEESLPVDPSVPPAPVELPVAQLEPEVAQVEPEVAEEPAAEDADVRELSEAAALTLVPDLEPDEAASAAHPFGDPGQMDEDGFSAEHSYAEKAEIERDLLRTIETRLAAAKAALDLNTADAMAAYAEDIRTRIARFEAQMRDEAAGTQ